MEIKTTSEQIHNDSTILEEAGNSYYGSSFRINPYSGTSYASDGLDKFRVGLGLYDKYIINANISYSGSAGSIYPSMYVQITPNDLTDKLEYSQEAFETYSSSSLYIYQDGQYIMFRYRRLDLSYGHRKLNLATGSWSDVDGEPSGSVMSTSGITFNGYTGCSAGIVASGPVGSRLHTPYIEFAM